MPGIERRTTSPAASHSAEPRPRGSRLRRRAEAIDAATPSDRNRVIDALRALAIVGVVLGHWLVSVIVVDDAGLRIASPLQHMPELAALTWVLQLLGLFFFAGGWANSLSLRRAARRSPRHGERGETAAGRSGGAAAGRSGGAAAGRSANAAAKPVSGIGPSGRTSASAVADAATGHGGATTRPPWDADATRPADRAAAPAASTQRSRRAGEPRARFAGGGDRDARSPRHRAYPAWLAGRLDRMLRPVLLLAVLLACGLGGLAAAGWSAADLYTVGLFAISPLWFLPVYLVLTALTPLAEAAVRRWGAWAAAGPAILVVVLDVLRYGPWPDVPAQVGTPNLIAAWLVPYLLGVAFAQGRLTTSAAPRLLIAGVLSCAVLILLADYPASMTGVTGADRSNMGPPSLLVPAMALAQLGVALLCYDRLARLLRRPMLWAAVVSLNLVAMTVYLWHQTALLTTQLGTHALGLSLPALDGVPADAVWVAGRIAVFPLCAAVLLLSILLFRRWETRSAPRMLRRDPSTVSGSPRVDTVESAPRPASRAFTDAATSPGPPPRPTARTRPTTTGRQLGPP